MPPYYDTGDIGKHPPMECGGLPPLSESGSKLPHSTKGCHAARQDSGVVGKRLPLERGGLPPLSESGSKLPHSMSVPIRPAKKVRKGLYTRPDQT